MCLAKHFRFILCLSLSFNERLKEVTAMVDICIVFSRKVRNFLPRHSFVTIFNLFIRPLLDYGYVTFNRIYRSFIHHKLNFTQH